MSERYPEIDNLRGLAMIAMILIHSNAYFLTNKVAAALWNWSQFAVPVFLFCSAYIYYKKSEHLNIVKYFKKRFIRLLIPYYIFVIIFLFLVYWNEPAKITWKYVFQSLTLTAGIDINWLVLLFLCLTILMPILAYFQRTSKIIFYLYTIIAIIFSIIFIYYRWPFNYRFIMWMPWSVILIYTIYLAKYGGTKRFLLMSFIISGTISIILRKLEINIHHSLTFFDNKYPPNLYLISYGIGSIALLYGITKLNVFSFIPVKKVLHFFSSHSYSLFFIHYTFLYALSFGIRQWHISWIIFFLAVLSFSVLTQIVFDVVSSVAMRRLK